MKITRHYANIPKNASWNIFTSIWFQEKWLAISFCVYFCYCNMILFLCLLMSKMCHFLLRPSFLRNSQLGHLHSLSLILDAFFSTAKKSPKYFDQKTFFTCVCNLSVWIFFIVCLLGKMTSILQSKVSFQHILCEGLQNQLHLIVSSAINDSANGSFILPLFRI